MNECGISEVAGQDLADVLAKMISRVHAGDITVRDAMERIEKAFMLSLARTKPAKPISPVQYCIRQGLI